MTATVRPEKLQEALNAKLDAAQQAVFDLLQSERPELNRYSNPQEYMVTFLHAARGVVPVLKTFADERQQPKDFENWRAAWEARLRPDDRTLWQQMFAERVAQEHGEGAGLIAVSIPITRGPMPQDFTNYAALGIERPPGPSKGGVRFASFPDELASRVCGDYLGLCRQFAEDFQRENAHLFGSKKP